MIRRMTKEDIPAAAALEAAFFSVPWTKKGLLESMESGNYIFVAAVDEDKVVGYGGMQVLLDEGDITNIVVDEAVRGKGLGTALTEALLEEGKSRGLKEFTLEVRVSNESAIHIYKKLGFESEGIRKRFYEKPTEDALIMWKRQ